VEVSDGVIGDELGSLQAFESTIRISGGRIRENFIAERGSTIRISKGTVDDLCAESETMTIISGGQFGRVTFDGGAADISGGVFAERVAINEGSNAVISGGSFSELNPNAGGSVSIAGGDIERVDARSNVLRRCLINIVGSGFLLDGEELTTIPLGEPFSVTERGVPLACTLADGTERTFQLNNGVVEDEDRIDEDTIVQLTRVLPSDVNGDGVRSEDDVFPFVEAGAAGEPGTDLNADGEADIFDLLFQVERLDL